VAAVVATAASAVPPVAKAAEPAGMMWGIHAGFGTDGNHARFGRIPLDADGNPLPMEPARGSGRTKRRPKLSIMNWWTGAYRVDDPGDDGGSKDRNDEPNVGGGTPVPPPVNRVNPDAARAFREQASAFRDQAREQVRQAQAGLISARKAAREQIRAARSRAAEIRARVRAGRHVRVTVADRQPTPWAVVAVVLTLGAIFGGVFMLQSDRSSSRTIVSDVGDSPASALMVVASNDLIGRVPLDSPPILEAIRDYRDKGYTVIVGDADKATRMASLVAQWHEDADGPADAELEDMMEAQNVYGVMYLSGDADRIRDGRDDVNVQVIYSTRDGAEQRPGPHMARSTGSSRVASAPPPDRGLPLLLINDHPAKFDPAVEARITRVLQEYAEHGWTVAVNDEAEAAARTIVVPGVEMDSDSAAWTPLANILQQAKFGGILHITAGPGDAPPAERVLATRLVPPAGLITDEPSMPDQLGDAATIGTESDNPSVSLSVDAAQAPQGSRAAAATASTTTQPARP